MNLTFTLAPEILRTVRDTNAPGSCPPSSRRFLPDDSPPGARRTPESASIYLVDDEPGLTELYTHLLQATGCRVRSFHDRAEALAALSAENRKPDLLITDCLGHLMPAEN